MSTCCGDKWVTRTETWFCVGVGRGRYEGARVVRPVFVGMKEGRCRASIVFSGVELEGMISIGLTTEDSQAGVMDCGSRSCGSREADLRRQAEVKLTFPIPMLGI